MNPGHSGESCKAESINKKQGNPVDFEEAKVGFFDLLILIIFKPREDLFYIIDCLLCIKTSISRWFLTFVFGGLISVYLKYGLLFFSEFGFIGFLVYCVVEGRTLPDLVQLCSSQATAIYINPFCLF